MVRRAHSVQPVQRAQPAREGEGGWDGDGAGGDDGDGDGEEEDEEEEEEEEVEEGGEEGEGGSAAVQGGGQRKRQRKQAGAPANRPLSLSPRNREAAAVTTPGARTFPPAFRCTIAYDDGSVEVTRYPDPDVMLENPRAICLFSDLTDVPVVPSARRGAVACEPPRRSTPALH